MWQSAISAGLLLVALLLTGCDSVTGSATPAAKLDRAPWVALPAS